MRAMRSWLSLLATVVALLVANPGFASVAGASGLSAVAAVEPSHCANMPGHAPAGHGSAAACEHCLLCGVGFIAPPEAPTAGRVAKRQRFEPLLMAPAPHRHAQARAHPARASPVFA
ncbi:MAG: hypothetical protein WAK01_00940 [Methylocystis sp.]